MNKQILTGFIVGLLIGSGAVFGLSKLTTQDEAATRTTTQQATSTAAHNEQATGQLKDLTGDEFDKAFIDEMIAHHQGAIDMAKLIETNAKHDELKKLGQDIMTAQSKEIEMMQGWLKDWGYEATPEHQTSH